jgi:hypothetical protein
MKLILDTSSTEFQMGGEFTPRLDKDGNQRRDKQGGTNLPLWAANLVAWSDGTVETILVTVALAEPPKVSQGQYVSVQGLQAMPWVQNGNSRVAFRADSIVPINKGAAPAPKAN